MVRMHKHTCAEYPIHQIMEKNSVRGHSIPQVTIKTGLTAPDGREELLTEYLCDTPNCPNIATHALGCVREVGVVGAVCDEHAPQAAF